MIQDHPHRTLAQLIRVLPITWHDSILLKGWSLHRTRGASEVGLLYSCAHSTSQADLKEIDKQLRDASDASSAAASATRLALGLPIDRG